METPQHFTDKCAVVRGLQVAHREAPAFAKFVAAMMADPTRNNMLKVARETRQMGFPKTADGMEALARDL